MKKLLIIFGVLIVINMLLYINYLKSESEILSESKKLFNLKEYILNIDYLNKKYKNKLHFPGCKLKNKFTYKCILNKNLFNQFINEVFNKNYALKHFYIKKLKDKKFVEIEVEFYNEIY